MRNLVYRVGPKTPDLPSAGRDAKFWASNCHASEHCYLLGFCNISTPEALQDVDIGHLGATMSAATQFGVKIGPNLV